MVYKTAHLQSFTFAYFHPSVFRQAQPHQGRHLHIPTSSNLQIFTLRQAQGRHLQIFKFSHFHISTLRCFDRLNHLRAGIFTFPHLQIFKSPNLHPSASSGQAFSNFPISIFPPFGVSTGSITSGQASPLSHIFKSPNLQICLSPNLHPSASSGQASAYFQIFPFSPPFIVHNLPNPIIFAAECTTSGILFFK